MKFFLYLKTCKTTCKVSIQSARIKFTFFHKGGYTCCWRGSEHGCHGNGFGLHDGRAAGGEELGSAETRWQDGGWGARHEDQLDRQVCTSI